MAQQHKAIKKLQAEVKRLEAKIDRAPHAPECQVEDHCDLCRVACNCWKKEE